MTLSSPVIGTVQVVGNTSGGTDYQLEAWTSGKVIRQIQVWDYGNRTKAVKLWQTGETDNQCHLYGSPAGSSSTYTFQPGELITSMSLWLGEWDHVGDRASAIMFTTSLGNTFQHGYQGGSATVINVYSGILVGADIRAGDDLNARGFAFLLPLVSCQLQDVRYYNISALGSIVPETLDTLKCSNNSEVPVQWKIDGSKDMTISYSWSQAEGLTTSQTVTVNASILDIFKTESSYQWQESEQSTNTVEHSGTKNLE
ncbi:hypothetical protein SELMODRAFT_431466 [Selaginella moellendorffii]|uniref:Jacalin-type lectin domain-containing protein n=1 Tax=Selaginella moellendorffii TaxID=88036 RepID=D8TCR4_SELML|nr:aerolysin-like protein [Selaginella moellendorffii]EFJ05578.1 hypothetical protein SELMODRAFT_431466 [Selaginella moellendorffii]|eukprot:XP_002993393.1 aerolysin-like protein [Selaginella moellendorffii]